MFHRLKLTEKALLPLMLMAVAFAATIGVGVTALERTAQAYRQIVDHEDPAVLRIAAVDRRTDLIGYSVDRNLVYRCLGKDAADCARTERDLNVAIQQGEQLLDEAIAYDPGHRREFEHFRAEFRAIVAPARVAMGYGMRDEDERAKAIMAPVNDRILALADELTRYASDHSAQNQLKAQALAASADKTRRLMILEGVLAAMLGLGFTAWIAFWEVTLPLTKLNESMARLAAGELDVDVKGQDRGDEIGAMARSVQVFKENAVARLKAESEAAEVREAAAAAARDARSEMARVARVLSVGELASTIAHEINQPIAAVTTNGEAALRWLSAGKPNVERARSAVERAISDAQRASGVVSRVRAMLAKTTPELESIDLNRLVEDVVAFTQDELRRLQVSVRLRLTPDLPAVWGDRIQLQQVVLNLILNGVEAMREVKGRARTLAIRTGLDEAGDVVVSVEDRGVGVAPEAAEHLFDPFFTTKQGGIGLGLPISRSIVEAHGGRIWADAAKPRGAVFQFCLPRATAAQVPSAA